eukprot:NODE_108_length_19701_cov_0.369452.p17 type:complete len:102 gc:universal NODE_108_length_19701_cov_0.369452:3038-3343(+)
MMYPLKVISANIINAAMMDRTHPNNNSIGDTNHGFPIDAAFEANGCLYAPIISPPIVNKNSAINVNTICVQLPTCQKSNNTVISQHFQLIILGIVIPSCLA